MQKKTLKDLVLLGLPMVIALACSPGKGNDQQKNKPAAETEAPKLPVDITVAKKSLTEQSETIAGSIIANRTVDIMSELPKKVTAVLFKDGSIVRKDQPLYKLEDADIRARLRQAQAELNLAMLNERRLSALLKTETIRREEYDLAFTKLQSLEASKDLLETELYKTTIKAPFTGIIGVSKAFTGTWVSPGMPLVNLQEQNRLKIQFSVAEKYLPLISAGKQIQFSTETNKEKITATILSAEASVDMQTRNIIVYAGTDNRNGKLKPGMSAKVFLKTSAGQARDIVLPSESLIPGGKGYSVFVVKNGLAKITPVTIGDRTEKEVQIASGITKGDTVIISNILRASDGVPVTIVSKQ